MAITPSAASIVTVRYNLPTFQIEKEGASSITMVVIGILFVAGGVTVGVLGLKEILPLGRNASIGCIAGGSAAGVIIVVSGCYSKAISNCRNGLSRAGQYNQAAWGNARIMCNHIKSDIYTGVASRTGEAIKEFTEVARCRVTKENANAAFESIESVIRECTRNSICVSVKSQPTTTEPHGHLVIVIAPKKGN